MAEDLGERTELPSQRKLEDARKRGQVAKSTDLAGAIELIGSVLLLAIFGAGLARALAHVVRRGLSEGVPSVSMDTLGQMLREMVIPPAIAGVPVLLLMAVVGVLAHMVQFGPLFTTQPLTPKFERLNPIKGLANLYSRKNVVKGLMSLAKVAVVAWVGWMFASSSLAQVASLPVLEVRDAAEVVGLLSVKLVAWLLALLLVLGVADYLFQRWQHTQELKMTKQEVQDERRSMEGDPQLKSRRLRMMRDIAMQQINQAVPKADVIVTNPTHYSIALSYDRDAMRAPRVVAKGVDHMAMRIRQVALVHRVPIVERPPLARTLYADVQVGQEISPEFYQAVAEVLAYVYRLEREAA
jgi:flagellar biosynthetic protein FlhB